MTGALAEELFNSLISNLLAAAVWPVHRAASIGVHLMVENLDARVHDPPVAIPDLDVFGQSITQSGKVLRTQECGCPHCGRSIAASRFAPHLEKCMGMGRNSSRIAKRRLAAHARMITSRTCDAVVGGAAIAVRSDESDGGSDEDSRMGGLLEDDDDWLSSKKTTRTGAGGGGGRRTKFRTKRRKTGVNELKTTGGNDDWGVLETDDSLPSLLGEDALPVLNSVMSLRTRK